MSNLTDRLSRVAPIGMIAIGVAVGISSFGIVRAERAKPNTSVSYSCNTGTACVEGSSTGSGTWGLYGVGTKDDGVRGVTMTASGGNGVTGFANGASTTASGVFGKSVKGFGVSGTSEYQTGVQGESTDGNGVSGFSTSDAANGVYGSSSEGTGVYGASGSGFGIVAQTGGRFAALVSRAVSGETPILEAENTANGVSCNIDNYADLTCSGTVTGSVLQTRHRSSNGRHVLTYASESATATIEDVGTARMSGGIANVRIDPDFASVMDGKWYYVFLTPLGDTSGLYVSMKTPSAFRVRETEHGRSTLEFDYRIIAHPLDGKSDRLPEAPSMKRPHGS
jgi:hypothetical protein